jgi:tRNA threonylcarbamoyladenosine biosynthesis protein TsaB
MITILQIETATQTCSAAVAVNGKTIAVKEQSAQNIHAGSLTLFIEEVMGQCDLKYADLDAIAVSKGPGSYTGLRIGVSTAKGICFALDKPLIAVDTLQTMAVGFISQHPEFQGQICPMIDARRMEVFTTLFNSRLESVLPVTAKVIEADSFSNELNVSQIAFIGDGAMKCSNIIQHSHATFLPDNFNSASYLSDLAFKAFKIQDFVDVAYFEPYYLKDFVFTQAKKKF